MYVLSLYPSLPIIFSICCFVFFTIPLLSFTLFYQRARITKFLNSTEMKAEKVKLLFKRYEYLWLSDATADFKNYLLSSLTVTWVPFPSTDVNGVAAPVRYKIDGTLCHQIISHIDLSICLSVSLCLCLSLSLRLFSSLSSSPPSSLSLFLCLLVSLSSSPSHSPFCLSLCLSVSLFFSLAQLHNLFSFSFSFTMSLSLSLHRSLTLIPS